LHVTAPNGPSNRTDGYAMIYIPGNGTSNSLFTNNTFINIGWAATDVCLQHHHHPHRQQHLPERHATPSLLRLRLEPGL